MKINAMYAQSGGVTAVINATACGVIETVRQHPADIGTIFAARNGIIGVLSEDLIDTSYESDKVIHALRHTPAGAFGSCRYKLKSFEGNKIEYERIVEVFKAHNIGYFFYNGGGDSQDTVNKVSQICHKLGYPINCIGIPKTIDNDLPVTDVCPGFGSVAKYVAVSIREAGLDVASMAFSSTKIFILEVMGRHAGWIAAAAGLAQDTEGDPPHIILFPEVPFIEEQFYQKVYESVLKYGFCAIVISEGVKIVASHFLSNSGSKDAFGHSQLGGVAPLLAQMVRHTLGFKCHWAISDYLQRSARHIASKTDVEQAYALGEAAVNMAISGKNAVMPIIKRESNLPYRWSIGDVALAEVANIEKKMPTSFISNNGFEITLKCRRYLEPLIQGEDYPPYKNGLPDYARLNNIAVTKKLPEFKCCKL